LNTIDSLFVTHLDLLDDLDEIKVCTAYKRRNEQPGADGKQADTLERVKGRLPPSIREFGNWEAEFEKIKGWKQNTQKATLFSDLPNEA